MSPEILAKLPPDLQMMYQAYLPEIMKLRRQGQKEREQEKVNPLREHNPMTRPYHVVEEMILHHLCPDLKSKNPWVKKQAMRWVLKQPWGEDFKPAPIHKKFRGIDLGSSNAA